MLSAETQPVRRRALSFARRQERSPRTRKRLFALSFSRKYLTFSRFVVYYSYKAILTGQHCEHMSGARRHHGAVFTLSAAETVTLIILLITLFGAVLIRGIQRIGESGRGMVVRATGEELRHLIDPNTASEEELTLVPGIAAARARKIVEYRRKHGGFGVIDDLADVDGFSNGLVKRLRKYLYVQPPRRGYMK